MINGQHVTLNHIKQMAKLFVTDCVCNSEITNCCISNSLSVGREMDISTISQNSTRKEKALILDDV